jgi:hypothetical protein
MTSQRSRHERGLSFFSAFSVVTYQRYPVRYLLLFSYLSFLSFN